MALFSSEEDYTDIPAKFHKERSSLPLLFISTPQDKFSSVTKQQPSAPILQRLILLAQESLRLVEVQLEDTGIHLDFKVGTWIASSNYIPALFINKSSVVSSHGWLKKVQKTNPAGGCGRWSKKTWSEVICLDRLAIKPETQSTNRKACSGTLRSAIRLDPPLYMYLY